MDLSGWEIVWSLKGSDAGAPFGMKFPKYRTPTFHIVVDGHEIAVDATFQGALHGWPGPKTLAKAGELATRAAQYATRAAQYATVAEGGTTMVGMGVAGPVVVVTGGVLLFVGTILGLAELTESAREEGERRAQVIGLRHGFAITLAAEAIRRSAEVIAFETKLDHEYGLFPPPVRQAYARGKAQARAQIKAIPAKQMGPWLDAVKAAHTADVITAHNSIFRLVGGITTGDPDEKLSIETVYSTAP